jgi:glutamate-ammonia-ligase adenylyltransferase
MINAISAQTNEGRLYEVDMRLRPSGNSGPIASSFDAFVQYHGDQAWTWEHLALTRARVVCGEEKLRTKLGGNIQEILTGRRDTAKLTIDVADMRARIDKEFHTTSAWETKYLRGGLLDIEFIAQYLQLRYAHSHPEILARGTRSALKNLRAMALLDGVIADRLIAGFDVWQSLQGILRLTMEGSLGESRESEMTAALRDILCRAGGAVDFEGLKDKIQATATAIYIDFQSVIEIPAQSANRELDEAEDPKKEEKI